MTPGAALLSALQEGSFASAMRDSIWLYPLIVPTGTLMFASDAVELVGNRAFVIKMLLLMPAMTNAATFHLGSFRNAELWDQDTTAPLGARLHAVASILIWAGVITCGRMIAYV